VEKCVRWKSPVEICEKDRVDLRMLPNLPTLRDYPKFGVIGTCPKYTWHVLAPYM